MDDLADSLPTQEISLRMAEQLAQRDGRFVPVSVRETDGNRLVCTMLIRGRERLRGVGYDDRSEQWVIVAERPETGVLEGLPPAKKETHRAEIFDRLDTWASERYDERTLTDYDPELE